MAVRTQTWKRLPDGRYQNQSTFQVVDPNDPRYTTDWLRNNGIPVPKSRDEEATAREAALDRAMTLEEGAKIRKEAGSRFMNERTALLHSLGDLSPDLTVFTDEELGGRQTTLNRLISLLTGRPDATQRRNEFRDVVSGALNRLNIGGPLQNRDSIANQVADSVVLGGEPLKEALGRFFTAQDSGEAYKAVVELMPAGFDYFTESEKDYEGQRKTIQDLLAARSRTAAEETTLADFISKTGPETLADITGTQVAEERKRAIESLQDLIPELRQAANIRGTLESGDLASEVAAAYGELLSPIEEFELAQKAADQDFFRDMAYQASLKKAIQGQEDLESFVESQRALAMGAQQQRFQTGLSAIRESSALAAFRRQNERALAAQEYRLSRERDINSSRQRAGLYGGIGTSLGALAGLGVVAATGGTALPLYLGAAAAGGVAGGGLGNLFSLTS